MTAKPRRAFVLSKDNIHLEQVKRGLYEYLKKLDMDGDWEVIVKPHKEDKSASQRGGFHRLLGIFSKETGYTVEELKCLCKKEALGTKEIEVMGRKCEVVKSSEEAKMVDYTVLIETCYRLAAEAGVILPLLKRRGS